MEKRTPQNGNARVGRTHFLEEIEAPRRPRSTAARQNLRGMFCLAAVLRSDRKEVCHF